MCLLIMLPSHRVEALSDDARLMTSDVCLSVAYIGPKSRTERPRKTKIDTEVGHVTCDSTPLSSSKGQRLRSQGRRHLCRPPAQLVNKDLPDVYIMLDICSAWPKMGYTF